MLSSPPSTRNRATHIQEKIENGESRAWNAATKAMVGERPELRKSVQRARLSGSIRFALLSTALGAACGRSVPPPAPIGLAEIQQCRQAAAAESQSRQKAEWERDQNREQMFAAHAAAESAKLSEQLWRQRVEQLIRQAGERAAASEPACQQPEKETAAGPSASPSPGPSASPSPSPSPSPTKQASGKVASLDPPPRHERSTEKASAPAVIAGAVKHPGPYDVPDDGITIAGLIARAGGIEEGLQHARIEHTSSAASKVSAQSFDSSVEGLATAPLATAVVAPGDTLTVRAAWVIKVEGSVKRPGTYTLLRTPTIDSVLEAAGGKSFFGRSDPPRVFRADGTEVERVDGSIQDGDVVRFPGLFRH